MGEIQRGKNHNPQINRCITLPLLNFDRSGCSKYIILINRENLLKIYQITCSSHVFNKVLDFLFTGAHHIAVSKNVWPRGSSVAIPHWRIT